MKKSELHKYMSKMGRRGGKATKDKHGPDYYRRIGKAGLAKRWSQPVDNSGV